MYEKESFSSKGGKNFIYQLANFCGKTQQETIRRMVCWKEWPLHEKFFTLGKRKLKTKLSLNNCAAI